MQQSAQAQAHAHAQSQARERGASTCLAHKTWLLPGGGDGVTNFTARVGRCAGRNCTRRQTSDPGSFAEAEATDGVVLVSYKILEVVAAKSSKNIV